MTYFEALCDAMKMCSDSGAVFMGQAVACKGTAMSGTFRDVPRDKLIELPVAEGMQLGMATGISLAGGLPVTCFPRFNFLLLAMSQLVNDLDALPLYSDYCPKVLIRVAVASEKPMHPGAQHVGDFTGALRLMLRTVAVWRLPRAVDIVPAYREALARDGSTLLVEYSGLYDV